jgi:Zn-dependent protease with chaperone function
MKASPIRALHSSHPIHKSAVLCAVVALLLAAPLVWADRTQVKTGWNIFTTDQDIQIGQKIAIHTESTMPMLSDRRVNAYLNALGHKIAGFAPGTKFPYEFHVVNSQQINSFALPGGEIFIYRGIIEEAGDEAQLAGVMAHEISHVALRHGTNQATKAEMSTGVLGVIGGMFGGGSVGSVVSQAGEDLAASSFLLKYSRATETQADVVGTQILYDSGYDPRAMGQFFENIENDVKHGRFAEMFSNHPIPEHRIERIDQEIDFMGGQPKDYKSDSAEFREIRRYVVELPAPPVTPEKGRRSAEIARNPIYDPDRPTLGNTAHPGAAVNDYEDELFTTQYPAGWQTDGDGDVVTILPPRGLVLDAHGNPATAYGVNTGIFHPQLTSPITSSSGDSSEEPPPAMTLGVATGQLLATMKQSRPNLKPAGPREEIMLDGQSAISVKLLNDSPLGGPETDWLVTVLRPRGLLYFICAAPQKDYAEFEPAFQKVISSIRLK